MAGFNLSPEKKHLLQQTVRRNVDPIEIVACTIFTVLLFMYVYLLIDSEFRFFNSEWAFILGPGVAGVLAIILTFLAYKKARDKLAKRRNLMINLAVCAWLALALGFFLGDQSYWRYTNKVHSYRDLASYISIDPAADRGLSYMDAGHVYFKDKTRVERKMYTRFLNGAWYCVAPIVRGNSESLKVSDSTATIVNGHVIPESGTYDWWAVGVNCCNNSGYGEGDVRIATDFTCGPVDPGYQARAGMRLLSDTDRDFYLLAVQKWSTTHGLPVRHPLFFEYVHDPLVVETQWGETADETFWTCTGYVVLLAFVVSFVIHMVLHRNKIY